MELVKNGFHARKSAVGKVYEYRIDTGIKQDAVSYTHLDVYKRQVTFNPSLDYIVSVNDFQLGLTNRTDSELILPCLLYTSRCV